MLKCGEKPETLESQTQNKGKLHSGAELYGHVCYTISLVQNLGEQVLVKQLLHKEKAPKL